MSELRRSGGQKPVGLHNRFFNQMKKYLEKFLTWFKNWNGLLTKEGGYISKPEIHAAAIPASMISASFMLPEPLGFLTFVSYLLMNKKGFDLLESDYTGHWCDVMEEYAYAAGSFAFTIAFWIFLVGETIEVGSIKSVITLLGV